MKPSLLSNALHSAVARLAARDQRDQPDRARRVAPEDALARRAPLDAVQRALLDVDRRAVVGDALARRVPLEPDQRAGPDLPPRDLRERARRDRRAHARRDRLARAQRDLQERARQQRDRRLLRDHRAAHAALGPVHHAVRRRSVPCAAHRRAARHLPLP